MSEDKYLTCLDPIGCVLANDLDIVIYDIDSQMYQVFLTNYLTPLLGTQIDNGGMAIGSYSPASVITMDPHTRNIANIPDDAVYFAWAYPLSGLDLVSENDRRKLDTNNPSASFALFGGFVFFGENKKLLQANAIYGGQNISFDLPKELSYGDMYSTYIGSGRLQMVTTQEFKDKDIESFCWVCPNEMVGGVEIAPMGGLMFVYKDKKVQYFEIIPATQEQVFDPFLENKTPFNTIQKCLKYIETEFNENLDGLSDKEIITKLTEYCKEYKEKVDELQDVFACKQCVSNPQDIAFNCGHMMCRECVKTVGNDCPICRTPISNRLNLYYT